MIKIKDLNHKISDYLDDRDILSLNSVNKYYYNVFDDIYWKRKFYKKFNFDIEINIYNEPWKFYYLLIVKWLKKHDHVSSILFAVSKDRSDLLRMIYLKNNYKSNIIRGWSNIKRESIDVTDEVIEEDAINCFKFIYKINNYYKFLLISKSIMYHSHNILLYLKENIKKDHILLIFRNNCLKCSEIVDFKKYANYNFINLIPVKDLIYINSIYNIPFHIFVKEIKDVKKIKSKLLEYNNFEAIKAITKYTSKFSDFSVDK